MQETVTLSRTLSPTSGISADEHRFELGARPGARRGGLLATNRVERPNVLFFAFDDLRPLIRTYGEPVGWWAWPRGTGVSPVACGKDGGEQCNQSASRPYCSAHRLTSHGDGRDARATLDGMCHWERSRSKIGIAHWCFRSAGPSSALGLYRDETVETRKVDVGLRTASCKGCASRETGEHDVRYCLTRGTCFARPRPEATVHLPHG